MIDLADSNNSTPNIPDYLNRLDSSHNLTESDALLASQLDPDEFAVMLEERTQSNLSDFRIRHTAEPLKYSRRAKRLVRLSTWMRHYPEGTAA